MDAINGVIGNNRLGQRERQRLIAKVIGKNSNAAKAIDRIKIKEKKNKRKSNKKFII